MFATRRSALIALGAVAALAAPVVALAANAQAKTEEPKYEVAAKHEGFEVRTYAPRIVAEVQVKGDAKAASSAGFRLLADFIFGNNTAKAEVAMTAPVDRSQNIAMTAPVDRSKTKDTWTIAFTMPSKYTLKTLPQPNNDRVKIREVPSTRFAVMRFSGNPNEESVQKRMKALETLVGDAGYSTAGKPPVYARYDPPWTISFLRRNEVFLELAPVPKA